MEYLAIQRVNKRALEDIDKKLYKHVRICYYQEKELLIIKYMPSVKHEHAIMRLHNQIQAKVWSMGISDAEFYSLGSARYYGANSSKEADCAYKPRSVRRQEKDWPTLVIEVGRSESLSQLRQDVRWWLIESKGEVQIALLMSIRESSSTLLIEKWELRAPPLGRSGPVTRSAANNSIGVPESVQIVEVTPNGTTGGPLVLEFDKIFLRAPTPPEMDVIIADQQLESVAESLFE
jgi:hypothetical protein